MRKLPYCPSIVRFYTRQARSQDDLLSLIWRQKYYRRKIDAEEQQHSTSQIIEISTYFTKRILKLLATTLCNSTRTKSDKQRVFVPNVSSLKRGFACASSQSILLSSTYFNIASPARIQCYSYLAKNFAEIRREFSSSSDLLLRNFKTTSLVNKNSGQISPLKCSVKAITPFLSSQMSTGNARDENADNKKYEPREISFKTSYGHIACLEWGQRDAPNKILCAHGWLDNAGSFEPLVPFILRHNDNYSKYHVVAMDQPGVGHSSHRPPGSEYTTFSHIIEMRRVTQQLGWDQNLTLLSHSMGGHLSFLYSCIYPKQVCSMISIDTTHPLTHQAANWHVSIGNSIEHYFKCEYYGHANEKLDTVMPVYTEADAIKRLMDAHSNSLTLESAKVMFKRGATKHPNGGCTFNRDVRHRHLSVEFRPDDELMLKFLEHTFKPDNLLIIRALRSPYHRPEEMRMRYYDLFERNCKLFRDVMLDGTHHLHMNSPDLVAIEINRFLDDAELARLKANEGCENGSPGKPLINRPNL